MALRDRQRREKVQHQADQAFRHRGIIGDDAIDECITEAEATGPHVLAEHPASIGRLLAEDAVDNVRFLRDVRDGRV